MSKDKKKHKKRKKSKKDSLVIGYKSVSTKMTSWYDHNYKFVVGKEHQPTLSPKKGDTASCGIGLHFCRKQEDVLSYTNIKSDYILLEVQANKSDILGEDKTKTRVSKLKVNKILKKVEAFGPEWKAAKKEIEEVIKKFLTPNKQATPQKLSGLIQAWTRASGRKQIKTHTTDNIYETFYMMDLSDDFYYEWCSYEDFSLKHLPIDESERLNERIYSILNSYLGSFEGAGDKKQRAEFAPLFEMLKLGVLPIGISFHSPRTLLIYAPKTDSYKMKSPF